MSSEQPKVTPTQGFLPSVADTFCLLDLIDGRLPHGNVSKAA